ncbi:hypothetical protein BD779DRAFT_1554335 [Infundibulicybe gibba]|nr:hypothetical protein BD779DRAFT_1554335 [Infundibulicybe gibba]
MATCSPWRPQDSQIMLQLENIGVIFTRLNPLEPAPRTPPLLKRKDNPPNNSHGYPSPSRRIPALSK